jgi:hypothetical protein
MGNDATGIANQWIASLIRLALAGVGGYFVRKGIADQSLVEASIAVVITGGIAAFWSLFHKYQVQRYVSTALGMPQHSTPGELKAKVENS